MKMLLSNKIAFISSILLLCVFFSCKKADSSNDPVIPDQFPDYVTKVSSSVSGFVTDENDIPVVGAEATCGMVIATTDRYGYFEFKNVQVVKDAATVTVSFPGYFKGIKTYMATEGKAAFFRIKLLPKIIAGTITASSGGAVVLPDGMNISFPANAVKNATTGAAYSGTVTVAAKWLDPTSVELHKIMPGDLRGVNTDGAMKDLTTYGMAAVELTGSAGEALQIADGKKATLSFPLPSVAAASAPATIPLWYFDEQKGLWMEEGVAVKAGNTYVGEVAHFSFWNCDIPGSFVSLNCTVTDPAGNPVSNVLVSLYKVSDPMSKKRAYTNENGFVSGGVPANEDIILEVMLEEAGCTTAFLTKQIHSGTSNISLENIMLPADAKIASLRGTVTDCNNNPVQYGFVIVQNRNVYSRHYLVAGAYNFSTLICNNNSSLTLLAEDIFVSKQSMPLSKNVSAGENVIANLQACAGSTDVYFDLTVDGYSYFNKPINGFPMAGDNIRSPDSSQISVDAGLLRIDNDTLVTGAGSARLYIDRYGPPLEVTGTQYLHMVDLFLNYVDLPRRVSPIYKNTRINITEFGAQGQFIAGSFSATLYEILPNGQVHPDLTKPHTVSCRFRARLY